MVLTLIKRDNGKTGEFVLNGKFDSTSYLQTEQAILTSVEKYDFTKIVLNMEKVDYVSSAALRSIRKLHVEMKKRGGDFTMKNINKFVMEIFEMTGLVGLTKIEQ